MASSDAHKCDEVIPATLAGLTKLCEAVYTDMCATAFIDGGCSNDDEGHANIDIEVCHDVSDSADVFTCSRCRCTVKLRAAEADAFENVTYGPTLTMPNCRGGELRFCPNCGRKVVETNAN